MCGQSTEGVSLARAITCGDPKLGSIRLLCIDGPAGSGKTTLAESVESVLRRHGRHVAVLHMDDLYDGWTGLDDTLGDRVLSQVLQPLSAGRPARWQRYDWGAGRFGAWQTLEPPSVLILEGCGSGARVYEPYMTLLVWVEATRDTRIARGVERDGRQVLGSWLAWMDAEAGHFAANSTRDRAGIRLISD